ncbi:hypothetical protein Goari_024109 [Gossypium aridum]|uniref:DUF4283 domain-containing protein n=1 Tax=Gossypium aridum TaxID=34290 RepID=A0A7J8X527_GOSAI|nr:hypothetical protein [Gossypium aridum]
MEDELAQLSINEEEKDAIHIQIDPGSERGKDPLQVPLVLIPFWVQTHDVPIGLFSENLATQLGNFLGNFLEYDVLNLGKENSNFMRIRVQFDIRLGHSDSFCEAKMNLRVEIVEMGWDLFIRAQSRRDLTMNSVWLREEDDGDMGGIGKENRGFRWASRRWDGK